ncbi:MAG: tandem-95 repeat protein [Anaerolineae bacterium]|nr:tandem-95 repeat protein [Anaerolineae bacterium]
MKNESRLILSTTTIAAQDANGDLLAITAPTRPVWLALTDHGGGSATLSGTPTDDHVGVHAVALLVTDSGGLTDTQSFTITVANVNDAPVAVDDVYSTTENTVLAIAAPGVLDNDTDIEDDPLTATLDGGPSSGVVDLSLDGSFTYTATTGFSGAVTFTYIVDDGNGGSDTGTVTITVTPGTT